MILEYHLTCLSQGLSYVSPVLPEAAGKLLPPMEEYEAGGDFQGTWDVRVLERAKTLQVAVWLHRLDMATTGGGEASYFLDTSKHDKGPLLGFLLSLQASSPTFEEVIHSILTENWDKLESLLEHVQGLRAQLCVELDDLQQTRKDELNSTVWKQLKKEMEQKQKDLNGLKGTISEYESCLRGCPEDDSSDSETGDTMATTPIANDALSVSAAAESLISPLGDETHAMEVDDRAGYPTPVSPVSPKEDDLLMGGTLVGVEGDMANRTVSSPGDTKSSDKGASI